ncbi:M48 family metallopeptidase [Pseudooceanicola sp. LIPI14-2-Ac024]|uniref:M48 family metallopeptidase n=1 Tax=Pseudooceanicola sp. LIPI14-2-Ac024 TaxID=3344875 RepID=UPI0035D03F44
MGQHILPGNPPVELNLKRSARARRISLRVSGLDGRVTLTMPRGVSEREALAFAREKAGWLRGHLEQRTPVTSVGIGSTLLVEGQPREVRQALGRGVKLTDEAVHVAGDPDTAGRRLAAWLKALARDRLAGESDRYAAALGRRYSRLTLRDTRSRWGSCTADGGLMYSWRLILAPPEVLSYVAAHEVAHLEEMNHSPDFWAAVDRIHGPYKPQRKWLRDNGATLHAYRFD